MTVRGLVSVMMRRWYAVALVLILAAVGGYLLDGDKGVYSSETVVSFIHPGETNLSPYSGLQDVNLIAFAGVVARELNGGATPAMYSTDEAPLYGAGIRQGVVVSLPNSGNQWVTSYQRAEVILQVVGPTERWVAETQKELLTRVVQISDAQQADVETASARISASPVALTKTIAHIVPSRTSTIAALSALLAAALIIGAWAAVVVDNSVRRRTAATRRHVLFPVDDERHDR